MKKFSILLNISLILVLGVFIWSIVFESSILSSHIQGILSYIEKGWINEPTIFKISILPTIHYSILLFFTLLAFVADLITLIVYNVKYNTIKQTLEEKQAQKAEYKARKAEENKQKRLAELQAEIDEISKSTP